MIKALLLQWLGCYLHHSATNAHSELVSITVHRNVTNLPERNYQP